MDQEKDQAKQPWECDCPGHSDLKGCAHAGPCCHGACDKCKKFITFGKIQEHDRFCRPVLLRQTTQHHPV